MWGPKVVKFLETESSMVIVRGWGWRGGVVVENEKLLFSGYKVSLWDDEKFWRWMMILVVQQCERKMVSFMLCILYHNFCGEAMNRMFYQKSYL